MGGTVNKENNVFDKRMLDVCEGHQQRFEGYFQDLQPVLVSGR